MNKTMLSQLDTVALNGFVQRCAPGAPFFSLRLTTGLSPGGFVAIQCPTQRDRVYEHHAIDAEREHSVDG
jgi:hypothetical protein